MATLVRHFGDLLDSQSPCGICDFCAPQQCEAQKFRATTPAERIQIQRILKVLRAVGSRAMGKLYAESFPNQEVPRRDFEELVGSLARSQVVQMQDASFEKDGKEIPYRVARLVKTKLDDSVLAGVLMKEDMGVAVAKGARRKKSFPSVG